MVEISKKIEYVHISDNILSDVEGMPPLYLSDKLRVLSETVAQFAISHPNTKISHLRLWMEKIRTGEKIQYKCNIDITTDLPFTEWQKIHDNIHRLDKSLLEGISQ